MKASEKVRIYRLISAEPIQDILEEYHRINSDVRQEIAEIVCLELTGFEPYRIKDFHMFRERYGIFAELLITMQVMPFWKNLKSMMLQFPDGAVHCIAAILSMIFTFMTSETHTTSDFTTLAYRLRADIESYASWITQLPETTAFKSLAQQMKYDLKIQTATDTESFKKMRKIIERLVKKHSKDLPKAIQQLMETLTGEEKINLVCMALAMTAVLLTQYEVFEKTIKPNSGIYNGFKTLMQGIMIPRQRHAFEKKLIFHIEKLAHAFGSSEKFKAFVDMIGRIIIQSGTSNRTVCPSQASCVHSIAKSADLSRIIPNELVNFTRPILKYAFYARLTEQALLAYELSDNSSETSEQKKRGPAVMLIDTSGSMKGNPERLAKAIGCALTLRMAQEHRALHIILFSGTHEQLSFTLHPAAGVIDDIIDFCAYSFGGNTDFDAAIAQALPRFSDVAFRLADLIMITDAGDEITLPVQRSINALKTQQNIRLFAVIIGEKEGTLAGVADEIVHINSDGSWDQRNSPSTVLNSLCQTDKTGKKAL